MELLREAARALMCHYGLELGSASTPTEVMIPDADFVGVLGFSSEEGVSGTLTLAMAREALAQSYPIDETDYVDWLGELANQLLGRFKNGLLKHGVAIQLSVPVVIGGKGLSMNVRKASLWRDTLFETKHGQVFMRITLAVASGVVLELEPESLDTSLSEGDAMLF